MDPDLLRQLAEAQSWIAILCVTIVVVCCSWGLEPTIERRIEKRRKPVDPTCPLHKQPRSTCTPESHEAPPDD